MPNIIYVSVMLLSKVKTNHMKAIWYMQSSLNYLDTLLYYLHVYVIFSVDSRNSTVKFILYILCLNKKTMLSLLVTGLIAIFLDIYLSCLE